jgi:hypothetical protein
MASAINGRALGRPDRSPVRITRARKVDARLADPMTFELDGGAQSHHAAEGGRRARRDHGTCSLGRRSW